MVDISKERSRNKLKRFLEQEIKNMYVSVLDYAEVAVDGDRFKPFRSRVLKAGNDLIRKLNCELDTSYTVDYIPAEEIIEVKGK